MSVQPRLTNEDLAHALLLDPTFQLDHNMYPPNTEYWDTLLADLSATPRENGRLFRLLLEIRDAIIDFGGNRNHVNAIFTGGMSGNWESFQTFIGNTMDVLRGLSPPDFAPELDGAYLEIQETVQVEGARAICVALEFFLKRVNMMRMDAANARLRLTAPVVAAHGIDYERTKFREKLLNGTLRLDRTLIWLHDVPREGIPEAVKAKFLGLVTAPAPIVPETVPETMRLDVFHLRGLQREYKRIVDGCTALAVVSGLPIADEAKLEGFADRLVGMPSVTLEACLDGLGQVGMLDDDVSDALQGFLDETHPTRQLAAAFVYNRYAGQASPFGPFAPLVEAQTAKLAAMLRVNLAVHLPTYLTVVGGQ
jgi:hypothetical protein